MDLINAKIRTSETDKIPTIDKTIPTVSLNNSNFFMIL